MAQLRAETLGGPGAQVNPALQSFERTGTPGWRFKYGIEPLCQVGTEADLDLLHEYYRDLFVIRGGEQHAAERKLKLDYEVRREVLLGLARILDVDLDRIGKLAFLREEREGAELSLRLVPA